MLLTFPSDAVVFMLLGNEIIGTKVRADPVVTISPKCPVSVGKSDEGFPDISFEESSESSASFCSNNKGLYLEQ